MKKIFICGTEFQIFNFEKKQLGVLHLQKKRTFQA
jgi:hypothetical protein|tara:strand:- start:5 stop:109 length:105 start_codon:yes stop_codon:yes gene_type:complete